MTTLDPLFDPVTSTEMRHHSDVAIEQARKLIEQSKIVVAESRAMVRSARPLSDTGSEQ